MKNLIQYIIIISCTLVIVVGLIFSFSNKIGYNNIKSISIDVFINSDGSAKITEIWNAKLTKGTEGYKPYGNLGNCEIVNFSVSDDLNNKYTTLNNWNVNASFESKKYKCGLNKTANKVELCWGISNYGDRVYKLEYTITNFVNQYIDSQGVYFSLMPKEMEQNPKSVKITMHSNEQFNEKNTKIWAFGYNGNINFENGNIVMKTNGKLSTSNYMTALVKINDGTFNTSNTINKKFDTIYNQAMEGVQEREKDNSLNSSYTSDLYKYIKMIMIVSFFIPIFLIFIIISKLEKKINLISSGALDFGKEGTELPKINKVEYCRDIPFNKNLYRAYWICCYYAINLDYKQGLIGAILLKWIRDEKVEIVKTQQGLFSLKDNNYAIDFSKIEIVDNSLEKELLDILKGACGNNLILESKEFEKWCKSHYNTIEKWFEDVEQKEKENLIKEGLIEEVSIVKRAMFGRKYEIKKLKVDSNMKEQAIQLLGLKRFLLDYSIIEERQAIEVKLWEEYLIFSQILGIAKKVEEQFSNLYPEFKDVSKITSNSSLIFTTNMISKGISAADTARERANRSSYNSYSSGSGGSSFSSGGSDASGSSSGGGFR